MNVWTITVSGKIYPARGRLTQWEIGSRNKSDIHQLSINLYRETVGTLSEGIQIVCLYKNSVPVICRFHRQLSDKSIWISTNRLKGGPAATDKWYEFLSSFGIEKRQPHSKIPVYLDFYSDFRVEIRL